MPAVHKDELQDMHRALVRRGFLIADFEATYKDEVPTHGSHSFTSEITSEITVRRTSTNTVRRYRERPGSPSWVILFDSHLAAGLFGDP